MNPTRIIQRGKYFYPQYYQESKTHTLWFFKWTVKASWKPFLMEYDGLFDDIDIAEFNSLDEAKYFIENGQPMQHPKEEIVWESK